MTRSLTVEYLRPVPLHQPHRITAHIRCREGRALHVMATGTVFRWGQPLHRHCGICRGQPGSLRCARRRQCFWRPSRTVLTSRRPRRRATMTLPLSRSHGKTRPLEAKSAGGRTRTAVAPASHSSTQRREAILDAALLVATSGGYEAVQMRSVAERGRYRRRHALPATSRRRPTCWWRRYRASFADSTRLTTGLAVTARHWNGSNVSPHTYMTAGSAIPG